MNTKPAPQWLAYVADVARDGTKPDADHPQMRCAVLAGTAQGIASGTVLWVCLPRDVPQRTGLAERAHAWFSPDVQWAATLVVTEAADGWARCRVEALNDNLPEMDFGVVGGMRVFAPKWDAEVTG